MAEALSSIAAVEERARREIIEVFGENFDLVRYFWGRATSVWHSFVVPGTEQEFATFPDTADTWKVEVCLRLQPEPPLPAYQLMFTERARVCLRRYSWSTDYLEWNARRALANAEPVDSGFADFKLPIVQQTFRCWPLDGGRVEVDAIEDDHWLDSPTGNVVPFPSRFAP